MQSTSSAQGGASAKPQLLAFVTDQADMDTLKAFASGHGWPDGSIHKGDIANATEYLKSHTSPHLLVVEIPSAEAAPGLLDGLADVCDPDTKVITVGSINEYSFYCWLMDLGIFSYLLKPLSQAALDGAYQKAIAKPSSQAAPEREPGKLVAVLGARGGVGATSIAINLAGLIADGADKNVGLVDADPQEGTIALMLDMEPSRGLREALEKPDRIDSLFLDRAVTRLNKHIGVLSAEESLAENVHITEQAANPLLKELRGKYDVTVMDIPHSLSPFSRQCIRMADYVVLVAEPTLQSLRDALRLVDLMRDGLKVKPPFLILNRVGLAPKAEVPPVDFENGVGIKGAHRVPFAPDVFMKVGNDIPAVKNKAHPAIKPLLALAQSIVPFAAPEAPKPVKAAFSLLKKPKES